MLINFLFPLKPNSSKASLLLLVGRIIFGLTFMSHGIQKWSNFQELSTTFPDPIGLGSSLSLGLAIFAEIGCSVAFIFGILYRLSLLPMIFTMIMAFFIIHGGDPFSAKELAFVYMVLFVLMYIAGPGKYSVDWLLGKGIRKNRPDNRT